MQRLRELKMGVCSAVALMALVALPAAAAAGSQGRPQPFRGGASRLPAAVVKMSPGSSSVPSPSNESYLAGVSCTSASDCSAVGWYYDSAKAQLNQALRWNGKKWKQVATPDPAGKSNSRSINVLSGVTCVTASECWAVGNYSNGSGTTLNEILRWNGKKWKRVNVPNPGRSSLGGEMNVLLGVACPSASDCWAVGWYTKHNGGYLNETLRWNGKEWSLVGAPHPAGTATGDFNQLYAVTCTALLATAKRSPALRPRAAGPRAITRTAVGRPGTKSSAGTQRYGRRFRLRNRAAPRAPTKTTSSGTRVSRPRTAGRSDTSSTRPATPSTRRCTGTAKGGPRSRRPRLDPGAGTPPAHRAVRTPAPPAQSIEEERQRDHQPETVPAGRRADRDQRDQDRDQRGQAPAREPRW